MKKRNKFLALFLAAALSVSVTACGSADSGNDDANKPSSSTQQDAGDSGDKQEEAPADDEKDVDALASAKEKMGDVSSMNAKMVMEMDMDLAANGESQSMQTVTTVDMSCFYNPMRFKADTTVDAGENGSTSLTVYAETGEDGTCTMYMTDGTAWQSQSVEMDALAQYDAASSMNEYLSDAYTYEAAGKEQVDGADAYKYTATMTGDDVKETLLSTGALDSFQSSLSVDSSQLESMMTDLGDITIDLWIDAESFYPVKYEMDMTSVMDALIKAMAESMADQAEGLSMSIPKMKMVMNCSNYNAAEDFTVPDEAKSAADATAAE